MTTPNDLDQRLRPGGYSTLGFLGDAETLKDVMAQDNATLASLQLSHDGVASAIEAVLEEVKVLRADADDRFRREATDIFDPYSHDTPEFTLGRLPGLGSGYLIGSLQVFVVQYRGLQRCPWGCELSSTDSSLNLLVLDRNTGQHFTTPGLSAHLIREHAFFEGLGTPFRTDPAAAARVLGLATGNVGPVAGNVIGVDQHSAAMASATRAGEPVLVRRSRERRADPET